MNRFEGLLDEPRLGAPRSITEKQVEAAVTKTAGVHAGQQRPLEHAIDGEKCGIIAYRGGAVARLRITTPPSGEPYVL